MKIVTSVGLIGILCVTSASFSKAGTGDLAISESDSSAALRAESLEGARDLSGKFISGSGTLQPAAPVYVGIQNTSRAKDLPPLVLSTPGKMNLTANVPAPATQSTTEYFQKSSRTKEVGGLAGTGVAIVSTIVDAVSAVAGGLIDIAIGITRGVTNVAVGIATGIKNFLFGA